MIIGNDHKQVVQNIREAAEQRNFHQKVEVNDPKLTTDEKNAIIEQYLRDHKKLWYKICNMINHFMVWVATRHLTKGAEIEGLSTIKNLRCGAVITCNHFNPSDNAIIRRVVNRAFHQHLYIVSQETNLAMKGLNGFILKYTDIIPISSSVQYMKEYFAPTIKEMLLEQKRKILIYPEEEMWLNYRKPREPERGAYYYAAVNSAPIISCFTELRTQKEKETDEFFRTKYILHILPTIYPDPEKSVRENSQWMMHKDYEQKKAAYETAYGRPLVYDWEPGDVAGWAFDESECK